MVHAVLESRFRRDGREGGRRRERPLEREPPEALRRSAAHEHVALAAGVRLERGCEQAQTGVLVRGGDRELGARDRDRALELRAAVGRVEQLRPEVPEHRLDQPLPGLLERKPVKVRAHDGDTRAERPVLVEGREPEGCGKLIGVATAKRLYGVLLCRPEAPPMPAGEVHPAFGEAAPERAADEPRLHPAVDLAPGIDEDRLGGRH